MIAAASAGMASSCASLGPGVVKLASAPPNAEASSAMASPPAAANVASTIDHALAYVDRCGSGALS